MFNKRKKRIAELEWDIDTLQRITLRETGKLCARVKELKERNAELNNWITVEDELPKEYKCVLILCANDRHYIGKYECENLWTDEDDYGEIVNVEFWQPLPKPPKDKL